MGRERERDELRRLETLREEDRPGNQQQTETAVETQ